MNEIALSTSWNSHKHTDAKGLLGEIKQAGFSSIELNFTLSRQIVDDITVAVNSGDIKVTSLHNYCPVPDGIEPKSASPDIYSIASLSEEERQKAIYFTKKTIDCASRMGARSVIIHSGKVLAEDHTRKLIGLYEKGLNESDEFMSIREEALNQRKEKAPAHLSSLFKSLDELNSYAEDSGVLIGVENRFYFMEIPSADEIGAILKKFENSSIKYWHDIGHGYIFEKLGFISQNELLERFSAQMAGMHIHDVRVLSDHISPGSGDVDFSCIKQYIRPDIIKVIEVHKTETEEDVKEAIRFLKRLL